MSENTATFRIANVPGDGIGNEVVPEGLRVLEAVGRKYGIDYKYSDFDWSCERYAKTGSMMPEDGIEQLRGHDAIFLGAVGFPNVPDHVSLWGLLIPIRREFQQYVNLRPVRLLPGITPPVHGYKAGDIDFYVVRENCEGEYSSMGGRIYGGLPNETVIQESVFTRMGVDRILKYAFELAKSRKAKHLTSATKSNGIIYTMPYWDERFAAMKKNYPGIKTDQYHIDILTAHFVRHPDWFDVVVGSNLFGDILSDLGPGGDRHDRGRAVRQHQPGARASFDVRAGARLGARHRGPGHRQPDRPDLVGGDDARTISASPRPARPSSRRSRPCCPRRTRR